MTTLKSVCCFFVALVMVQVVSADWFVHRPDNSAGNISFSSSAGAYIFEDEELPFGTLKSVEYYATATTKFKVQIWRYIAPVLQYKLKHSFDVTPTKLGVNALPLPVTQIYSGDVVGFASETTVFPISRRGLAANEVGENIYRYFDSQSGSPSIGTQYMLRESPADSMFHYNFGIEIDPYKAPTLPPTDPPTTPVPATTTPPIIYIKGPPGPPGPQGQQGQNGSQGNPGPKGEQGIKGDSGIAGAPGIQGVVGPQGVRGDQGPVGPTGGEGPKGDTGLQGAQGLKGDAGPPGSQGIKGDTGSPGSQGAQGSAGSQGPKGIQGIVGPKGAHGDQGPKGSAGDTGAKGETGIQGPPGMDAKDMLEINECSVNNGGCEHDCIDTYGSFECACNKGFKLDANKKSCIDINECSDSNGMCAGGCENTRGSYICSCPSGYTLDNNRMTCGDIDECKGTSGLCSTGICVNLPGGYTCMTSSASASTSSQTSGTSAQIWDTDYLLNRWVIIAILIWIGLLTLIVLIIIIIMCMRRGSHKDRHYREADTIYSAPTIKQPPPVQQMVSVKRVPTVLVAQPQPVIQPVVMANPNASFIAPMRALPAPGDEPSRSVSLWSRRDV